MKILLRLTYLILLAFTSQVMAQNDALTILPNGNVGIGAMAPTQKLDVNGNMQVRGNINAQGTVQAQQLSTTGTINTTKGKIQENNHDLIPRNIIIMWYGTRTTIPEGWAICNGKMGTPDLRDRFIVAAGKSYSANDTGGQNQVTLTMPQMPRHSHKVFTGVKSMGNSYDRDDGSGRYPAHWDGSSTQITDTRGNGQSHENRPLYHALYFLMKL